MKEIQNVLSVLFDKVSHWVTTELFAKFDVYQLGVVLVVLFVSFFISKLIKKLMMKMLNKNPKHSSSIKYEIFVFPILLFLFSMLARFLLKSMSFNFLIIKILLNLTTVWIIVNIFSLVFQKAIWLRPMKYLVWLLATLNIFGLLNDFLKLLEQINFKIGDNSIHLLFVFKSIIVTFFAFGLAFKISNIVQGKIDKNKKIDRTIGVLLNKTLKIVLLLITGFYVLNIIGVKLTAFAVVGGAVGVGIGFGLQKIVSNFISGFILLLDKSIKPGDVIEIENTFGVIQSMSARYITVLTLTGKEHLIPNEDLITNRVINWSHTNKLIMIEVAVGVSYNTDIPQALDIIKTAAMSVKRVYEGNDPVALISDFGNSSIDLKVKFWISDPEEGVENIRSNIRLEIWKKFKENKIEIPFPQRDVHIKHIVEKDKLSNKEEK